MDPTKKLLKEWNLLGILPGPEEKEKDFIKRAEKLQKSSRQLENSQVLDLLNALFDIRPSFVSVNYSNQDLMPWHAGCSLGDDHIQLRKSLEKHSKYLFYDKKEILAHEMVHAARAKFSEELFEEIFAYQTAQSKMRKSLGALFSSYFESCLFVLLIIVTTILDLYAIVSNSIPPYFRLIPLLYFFYLSINLYRKKQSLQKALIAINHPKALAIALRLKDSEILAISSMNQKEALSFMQKQTGIRWQMIQYCYLQKSD